MHNYILETNSFPGELKHTWLIMIHKRGIRTQLSNWRGIMLSNSLANSPMGWLNYHLSPYVSRTGLIPDTQAATQQWAQTRDLLSFLSSVECWANRNHTTVYAVKRDQMKGSDYLSPSGFYDVIRAYGLPTAIIELEQAAQSQNQVYIKTAHGTAGPITVTGVTKQGDPLSPLKSTLTTSLGHWWLFDMAETKRRTSSGELIITFEEISTSSK